MICSSRLRNGNYCSLVNIHPEEKPKALSYKGINTLQTIRGLIVVILNIYGDKENKSECQEI